ncbi:hypothetical protein BDB01DRAFT_748282 [Pilobolus umbonatus]|nr:hypothetical protein BDB01DRAFT_748282 [Pilobolus umbonatus]
MSRNLVVNTVNDRRKWSPSPELAITEEEDDDDNNNMDIEEDGSDYTSSPSIPDENINFDLVYTLHTFEATVDGQASVKKGDALTLLDDSNSYWWLIRDLKTSEVGYIPAEHIETPFERLARLNKHRNVELTSIEQASYYINQYQPKKSSHSRKVIMSTSLNVQAQILLTAGDDSDDIEERYEEWNEEMEEDEEDVSVIQDEPKHKPIIRETTSNYNSGNNSMSLINASLPAAASSLMDSLHDISHDETPVNTKVLRVYAGNINVGTSYHSVRVSETTSVDELLSSTLEKFHIPEIETVHGRNHGSNSCIEYYLTVKTHDGEEIILDPQDKPYTIYESLTSHFTTPMPSLTQFRQYSTHTTQKKKKRIMDTQFFMHKRIKRVNDKNGHIYIKVSLMTPSFANNTSSERNSIIKMASFRRFSKKKSPVKGKERIDKLIATPNHVTIADLTTTALVKFHILADEDQPHQYKLLLHANGKDTLLNGNQLLSAILTQTEDPNKYFILHNLSQTMTEDRSISLSSSTSSSTTSTSSIGRATSSKVFPEKYPNRSTYQYTHHPVMTRLDHNTESILKRIDAALEEYNNTHHSNKQSKKVKPTMSVARNESGVDIQLPHGLLRSTAISDTKTQYSLMTTPNRLVMQKILPSDQNGASKDAISGEEMASLIRYGTQFLDTYDSVQNTSSYPNYTYPLSVEKDKTTNLSSLDDLEKELQRIITSHTSYS